MVCRPHQYIIRGMAAAKPAYSDSQNSYFSTRYARNYAEKPQVQLTYGPSLAYKITPTTISDYLKPQKQADYFAAPAVVQPNMTFSPRRKEESTQPPIPQEENMQREETKQEIKQSKQRLAKMILKELEQLGPSEEHEHGAHTHVH